MLLAKNKVRNQVIGLVAVVSLGIGVSEAQAFDIGTFATQAQSAYDKASVLFASGSALYKRVAAIASSVPNAEAIAKGDYGIYDPNTLYEAAVNFYKTAKNDPSDPPESADLKGQRLKAAMAGKTGTAALTKEGQTKDLQDAQKQTNLAAAADQSAKNTEGSTSSLEALQNSVGATNAVSQQLKLVSAQMLQANQTAAASVQIEEQIGKELSTANKVKEIEQQEQVNTITRAGAVPFPLFYKH